MWLLDPVIMLNSFCSTCVITFVHNIYLLTFQIYGEWGGGACVLTHVSHSNMSYLIPVGIYPSWVESTYIQVLVSCFVTY